MADQFHSQLEETFGFAEEIPESQAEIYEEMFRFKDEIKEEMAEGLRSKWAANDPATTESENQSEIIDILLQFSDETKRDILEMKNQMAVMLTILQNLSLSKENEPAISINGYTTYFSVNSSSEEFIGDECEIGQQSPLKTEYPEVAHNLFDEMPSPPAIELNEENMLLDEMLMRVPVKNGEDVLDVYGFAGESYQSHLRSIELYMGTLNPWGESEIDKNGVDEVEKFFSSKIGRLEIGHHMFDEVPELFSALRYKGTVVCGEMIPLVVGLPRDLSYGSEVIKLNSFNISSKSKLEGASMFIEIKNHELDVVCGVDGMLMFIFDPGGGSLFYKGCDHFESNVEQGNYCLVAIMASRNKHCLIESNYFYVFSSVVEEPSYHKVTMVLYILMWANDCIHSYLRDVHYPRLAWSFNHSWAHVMNHEMNGLFIGARKLVVMVWDPGQSVIFIYILEDKDVLERVGKRIIQMVIQLEMICCVNYSSYNCSCMSKFVKLLCTREIPMGGTGHDYILHLIDRGVGNIDTIQLWEVCWANLAFDSLPGFQFYEPLETSLAGDIIRGANVEGINLAVMMELVSPLTELWKWSWFPRKLLSCWRLFEKNQRHSMVAKSILKKLAAWDIYILKQRNCFHLFDVLCQRNEICLTAAVRELKAIASRAFYAKWEDASYICSRFPKFLP